MNHVDTIAAPGSGTSANASSATPEECAQLVADVEAYCQEIRPLEEIAYLEHEPNPAIAELAKKYNQPTQGRRTKKRIIFLLKNLYF